jgi:hypothetical protein
MLHLGTILEVRDHPTHPIKVELEFFQNNKIDPSLDIGWLLVAQSAWDGAKFSDLKEGVQVMVWDTGYVGDDDKYRVIAFFPNEDMPLRSNRTAPARRGDPVAISGSPKLTPAAASTILTGVPPISPLGHDLVGRILGDE